MEGFAALLAGFAQKSKYALDLVVLGLSTPLHDDETQGVSASAQRSANRNFLFEETDGLAKLHPTSGLPMLIDGVDVAGNLEGYWPGNDSSHFA